MADEPTDTTTVESTDTTTSLRLDVPHTVRRDEQFTPLVAGLEPDRRVTLTARTDDAVPWSATATFEADDDGLVDLSEMAPVEGDYTTVDPMGLCWSLTANDGNSRRYEMSPLGAHELTVTAETEDSVASATVTVRHSTPGVIRHEPPADGPAGAWFEPPDDGPHPAVVVLHGSNGRPMVEEAGLLAAEGYAAFALQYLGTEDLPDVPRDIPLEYVEDGIEWFLDRETVADDGYGLYGISMGAQLALVVASNDKRVDAVVSDAGNPYFYTAGETTAWTRDGETFPCIGIREEPPDTWDHEVNGGVARQELWTQMLETTKTETRRAATIPVENAEAALLLLAGSDDLQWPSVQFGTALLARLDAVEYEYSYELDVYHEAGHGFGAPYQPTVWRPAAGGGLASGGEPAAHASAQAEAWSRLLGLFDDTLHRT